MNESDLPPGIAGFFDVDYYLAQVSPPEPAPEDALSHYLEAGWRRGYDPSPVFSTRGYLLANPDVQDAGINPLVHYLATGRQEGRLAQPDITALDCYFDPGYYRSRFEEAAPCGDDGLLRHYLTEGWRHGRDPSPRFCTDGYLYVYPDVAASGMNPLLHFVRYGIAEGRRAYPVDGLRVFDSSRFLVSVVLDAGRGGSFLLQTLQALENQAHGRVEAVVLCPPDLPGGRGAVRRVLEGVSLPAKVVSARETSGSPWAGWHEGIEAAGGDLVWIGWDERETGALGREHFLKDLAWSFGYPSVTAALDLGVQHQDGEAATVLPSCAWFSRGHAGRGPSDACGVLFRRQPPGKAPWRDAETIGEAKLRLVYEVSNGGQIAAVVPAQAGDPAVDAVTAKDTAAVVARVSGWRSPHVLIGFRGFHIGGAEIFPIHLANALLDQGFRVSMLSTQPEDEWPALRGELDPRVAVYDTAVPLKVGFDAFPGYAGIDLLSSHCRSVEDFFLGVEGRFTGIPYVVSLHGHYEAGRLEQAMLHRLLRSVTHWVYTTDRNLRIFDGLPLDPSRVSRIPNGMPLDARPFPRSRASLGIGPADLVFTLVARPVAGKGWAEAIQAVLLAQRKVTRRLVLLLCGDGPEAAAMRERYAGNSDIIFIGTQDRIHGLYAISDCALLPTRFSGESFPLCLIQAMQVGTPVIATAVSEIPRMTRDETLSAGPLLDAEDKESSFVQRLADLIVEMSDDRYRRARAADAAVLGERLDIGRCAKAYAALYETLLKKCLPPGRGGGRHGPA